MLTAMFKPKTRCFRLIHFMRTMEAITPPTQPVYFGAVVESGMNLLLCGRDWADQGKVDKGGICYAQGGAGYGLNLQAMKVLAASPTCDPSNQVTHQASHEVRTCTPRRRLCLSLPFSALLLQPFGMPVILVEVCV